MFPDACILLRWLPVVTRPCGGGAARLSLRLLLGGPEEEQRARQRPESGGECPGTGRDRKPSGKARRHWRMHLGELRREAAVIGLGQQPVSSRTLWIWCHSSCSSRSR